jgi:hypothetical protein
LSPSGGFAAPLNLIQEDHAAFCKHASLASLGPTRFVERPAADVAAAIFDGLA